MSNGYKHSFITALDGLYIHGMIDIDPVSDTNSFEAGVCKIEYKDGVLTVHARRPGLLFGKNGENFEKISKYVGCKINILAYSLLGEE